MNLTDLQACPVRGELLGVTDAQEEKQLRSYASLQQAEPSYTPKGDGSIESCREIEEDFL